MSKINMKSYSAYNFYIYTNATSQQIQHQKPVSNLHNEQQQKMC